MKIEPIKPNLISGNISVSLSAGEQRKGLQYSPTVNRTGKKIKNVSLRHYHLPTLSSGVNGVEHVDARKAIFARHCQKIRKIIEFVGQTRNVVHHNQLVYGHFFS